MKQLILGNRSEEDEGQERSTVSGDDKAHTLEEGAKGFRGADAAGHVSMLETFVKRGTHSPLSSPKPRKPPKESTIDFVALASQALPPRDTTSSSAMDGSWREMYLAHFTGLDSYGETGMTKLEELIDAAFQVGSGAHPFSASPKALALGSGHFRTTNYPLHLLKSGYFVVPGV